MSIRPPRRPGDIAFAVAVCAVLAAYNNVPGSWHRRWYPAVNAAAAAGLLAAARASGLTMDDLGLRPSAGSAGLSLGSATAVPVVAAFGLAALTPAARPVLSGQRAAGLTAGQLADEALLRIPVGTVAWEEIPSRGVLHAALRRVLAEPGATIAASVIFGLWHIRPTAEALTVNGLAPSPGDRAAAIAAAGAGTAAAAVLLSLLRDRSGSLAAPAVLHLAANASALLVSALTQSAVPTKAGPANPAH